MASQKPTIGRIVHFYDPFMARYNVRVGPYAAIVDFVHPDGTIDVSPSGQRNTPSLYKATMHVPENIGKTPDSPWWVWPPRE